MATTPPATAIVETYHKDDPCAATNAADLATFYYDKRSCAPAGGVGGVNVEWIKKYVFPPNPRSNQMPETFDYVIVARRSDTNSVIGGIVIRVNAVNATNGNPAYNEYEIKLLCKSSTFKFSSNLMMNEAKKLIQGDATKSLMLYASNFSLVPFYASMGFKPYGADNNTAPVHTAEHIAAKINYGFYGATPTQIAKLYDEFKNAFGQGLFTSGGRQETTKKAKKYQKDYDKKASTTSVPVLENGLVLEYKNASGATAAFVDLSVGRS